MTRPRALAVIAAGILLAGLALALLGYHALRQDRALTIQQARETLSAQADSAVREVRRVLERWREWPEGASIRPPRGLLWLPGPEPPPIPFDAAERAEIAEDWPEAIRLYQAAGPASPAALLRLARTWKKSGNAARAVDAWRTIAALPDSPSTLPALRALIDEKQADPKAVYRDFARGRFPLTRQQYAYYSERLRPFAADTAEEDRRLALTIAAESWTASPSRTPAPGIQAFSDAAGAIVIEEASLRKILANAARGGINDVAAIEPAGTLHADVAAVRAIDGLPWQIAVTPRNPAALQEALDRRQTVYLLSLFLLTAILFGAVWLAARILRREAAVARLQSDFVATVSHEFRSPLTGIRQLAELLASGVVADEHRRREYFDMILQESARLSRLVENLLDFSRVEAGGNRYGREDIPTAQWLRNLTSALRAPRLESAIPDALPAIRGDREALSSAVANLIDNALKYSRDTVRLDAAAIGGRLTITVSDQGPGIAPEEHARIFERFYRSPGELASEVKGAGIGLSLVKHIVEAHGGRIALDSAPGRGSRFSIVLEVNA